MLAQLRYKVINQFVTHSLHLLYAEAAETAWLHHHTTSTSFSK